MRTAEDSFEGRKRPRTTDVLVMVFLAAVVLTLALNSSGKASVSTEMDDERLGIAFGTAFQTFIPYTEITGVELLETFPMGERVSGSDWQKGWAGVYENEAWGRYAIYAYSTPGLYLVVHHTGGTIVFNETTKKRTEKRYEQLTGVI